MAEVIGGTYFPPGCTCERIDVGTSRDEPGTKFIRGRSDPPCRVHLPSERALYDAAYQRGVMDAANAVNALNLNVPSIDADRLWAFLVPTDD